jgi:hypothetical protein
MNFPDTGNMISVAEFHRRAEQITNDNARRIYLAAVASFPDATAIVRRSALAHAFGISVEEVEAAERELIRVGLAREVLPT